MGNSQQIPQVAFTTDSNVNKQALLFPVHHILHTIWIRYFIFELEYELRQVNKHFTVRVILIVFNLRG